MHRKKQTGELQYHYCPTCRAELQFKIIENRQVFGCPQCTFIYWNNPLPVVSSLIVQDNNVLLIKRKSEVYNRYWALPGGIIDYLEEPGDALKREVMEEVGITVDTIKLIDSYLIIYEPNGLEKSPSHTSIDMVYYCTTAMNITQITNKGSSSEVEEIGFFPINNLPRKIAFKHKEIINKHSSHL